MGSGKSKKTEEDEHEHHHHHHHHHHDTSHHVAPVVIPRLPERSPSLVPRPRSVIVKPGAKPPAQTQNQNQNQNQPTFTRRAQQQQHNKPSLSPGRGVIKLNGKPSLPLRMVKPPSPTSLSSKGSTGRLVRSVSDYSMHARKPHQRTSATSIVSVRQPKPSLKPFNTANNAWITENKNEITSAKNLVTCSSRRPGLYTAMWADGEPAKIGDRYWTLIIENLHGEMSIGVAERGRLRDHDTRGLFYIDTDLSNGSRILTPRFGPSFKSGDTVGLLVSHVKANIRDHPEADTGAPLLDTEIAVRREDRIKLYYFINSNPLGLVFEVPSRYFPNGVYPVVQFRKAAFVRIIEMKAQQIPRNRGKPASKSIDGTWDAVQGSVKIEGEVFFPKTPLTGALLIIAPRGRKQFEVFVHCVNSTWFTVILGEKTWTLDLVGTREREKRAHDDLVPSWGRQREEEMEMYADAIDDKLVTLDGYLGNWLLSPDLVKVTGQHMKIVKDRSVIVFKRRLKLPGPFIGIPF